MSFSKYLNKRYIYVIRPCEADEGAAEWEEAINCVKTNIEKMKQKLSDQNEKLVKSNENILTENRII
jgi:hypothetical protein